jgi:nicotinate dehydrogenase subunit A
VQSAWIEEQVSQCAYCINGWIMTAAALLARNPHPTDSEIKEALGDLICRCGTHNAALRAVKRAAQAA